MQNSIIKKFIHEAVQANLQSRQDLELVKKSFCRRMNRNNNKLSILSNAQTREVYAEMLKKGEIKASPQLENFLVTKKIRTLSGVAIVAVLTKPYPCPGQCAYCPDEYQMPKSYLSNEPAVMRAISTGFHPYKQVQARLRMLEINGHSTDKVEMIAMGGTFSHFPASYQKWFIKECFRALNDYPKNLSSKSRSGFLEKEKKCNEKARHRMIGLTLETRPDYINREEITNFRRLGATRIEIGVQHISDEILKLNRRGHGAEETARATKLLKEAGFKISYHLMPGLPGSSPKKDLEMIKKVFSDQRFQPDLVKIYPCVVTKGSEIEKWWKQGKYKPLTNTQNLELMKKIKAAIPPYVRISRLIRDIPEESILAGPSISNLRQLLQQENVKCSCIRCREVKSSFSSKEKIVLNRIDYPASDGKEVFLEYVSPDKKKLFALLRLRIPSNRNQTVSFFPALENSAIIRELHTYGKLVSLSQKNAQAPQHMGLGKKLIRKAEQIAGQEFDLEKIAVISGVGVRDYYRKRGYRLKDEYMMKKLKNEIKF
ncbi:MAG: tRNA uridine(34) 5-carboxymethylaminomethyl modification radical SAM/GNAT enzyme Elp3 [Candidatus Moranbacteria bacterium]|nr:tRNA uridine(34) 5-carboxymethylaminomethyl modification radical SAM/GNAT enzyme Elp3 [Candidatus Moranbacteria bacterium]